MERPPLHSIGAYADYLHVDLADLCISCFYCLRFLSFLDKVLFNHADLGLYCKDGICYAACQPCIKSTAKLDFLLYYQHFTSTQGAEAVFGGSFPDLQVRCWSCLRQLTRTEKEDVVSRSGDVALVRNGLRARCTLCILGL